MQHTKKHFFDNLTKNIGVILNHSHQMAIVWLLSFIYLTS